ncbi:MAG: hypothetical protein AAFY46_08540, partial [Planctomycetota bacterium]
MIGRLMNRLRGVWGLIRVFAATGFRRRGRYWRWREETAFGRGRPGNRELTEAALDYGVWTLRMRHLGR